MPKLTRKIQKVFGDTAATTEFGKFGSLAAGTPEYTKDPALIQSLPQYLSGWYGAILGANAPAIQDMNALNYLFSYQLKYLMQQGVAEWIPQATYFIGSIVNDGAGNLYISVIDDNISKQPSFANDGWKLLAGGSPEIIDIDNFNYDITKWTFVEGTDKLGVGLGSIATNSTDALGRNLDFKVTTTSISDAFGPLRSRIDYIESNSFSIPRLVGRKQRFFAIADLIYDKTVLSDYVGLNGQTEKMYVGVYEAGTLIDEIEVISGDGEQNIPKKLEVNLDLSSAIGNTFTLRIHSTILDTVVEARLGGFTSVIYRISNFKISTRQHKVIGNGKSLYFSTNNNSGPVNTLTSGTSQVINWVIPSFENDPYQGWDSVNNAYEFKKDCEARVDARFRLFNGIKNANSYLIVYLQIQFGGLGAWSTFAESLDPNGAAATNAYGTPAPTFGRRHFNKGDKVRVLALQNHRASAAITQSSTLSAFTVEEV